MFSSLASFIFGSNTSATTTSEANQNPTGQQEQPEQQQQGAANVRIDAENTIEVTSSTPSVTGTSGGSNLVRLGKRGKNRRNRNNKNKKQGAGAQGGQGDWKPTATSITKLLTPSDSFDEDFDEDDWFIVEKEDEEESLPRTDSEEELSIVELKQRPTPAPATPFNNNNNSNNNNSASQQRRRAHINSHSLYSGPRPHQQRNYLQRARNNGARGGALNVSTLSPPRSIAGVGAVSADGGITQSLYVVSPNREGRNGNRSGSDSANTSALGANASLMEESWFVTPPPCFTSIGPIHMETSPFENLLIEHPSMSVYHSIRSAQEATDSFVNLDLGVEESQQKSRAAMATAAAVPAAAAPITRNPQAVQQRTSSIRLDRYNATQLKQELFARNAQKSHDKKDRQSLCRGAIKRANKVRDVQAKGNRQRRADMQHCKVVSGANNNRKCCY